MAWCTKRKIPNSTKIRKRQKESKHSAGSAKYSILCVFCFFLSLFISFFWHIGCEYLLTQLWAYKFLLLPVTNIIFQTLIAEKIILTNLKITNSNWYMLDRDFLLINMASSVRHCWHPDTVSRTKEILMPKLILFCFGRILEKYFILCTTVKMLDSNKPLKHLLLWKILFKQINSRGALEIVVEFPNLG